MTNRKKYGIGLAVLAAVAALAYWWFTRPPKRKVLDPSNDAAMSRIFDAQNPNVSGVAG